MFRICDLLRLNIKVLVVLDGKQRHAEKRPGKFGPEGPPPESPRMPVAFRELLCRLGVPSHQAPADAEAECASLEMLGIVDAVWSGDSDSFLFGSKTVISPHPSRPLSAPADESQLFARVYRMETLATELGWTRRGVLLYALLRGCDYARGLSISAELAARLARDFARLGDELFCATDRTLGAWRDSFDYALTLAVAEEARVTGQNVLHPVIPSEFPAYESFLRCRWPIVTTEDATLKGVAELMNAPHASFRDSLKRVHLFLSDTVCPSLDLKLPWWPIQLLLPIEVNNYLLRRMTGRNSGADDTYGITVKRKSSKRRGETSVIVKPAAVFWDLEAVLTSGMNGKKRAPELISSVRACIPNKEMTFRLLDGVVSGGLSASQSVGQNDGQPQPDTTDDETRALRTSVIVPQTTLGKRKRGTTDETPTRSSKKNKKARLATVKTQRPTKPQAPRPAMAQAPLRLGLTAANDPETWLGPPKTEIRAILEQAKSYSEFKHQLELLEMRWNGPPRQDIARVMSDARSFDEFKKALQDLEQSFKPDGRQGQQRDPSIVISGTGAAGASSDAGRAAAPGRRLAPGTFPAPDYTAPSGGPARPHSHPCEFWRPSTRGGRAPERSGLAGGTSARAASTQPRRHETLGPQLPSNGSAPGNRTSPAVASAAARHHHRDAVARHMGEGYDADREDNEDSTMRIKVEDARSGGPRFDWRAMPAHIDLTSD